MGDDDKTLAEIKLKKFPTRGTHSDSLATRTPIFCLFWKCKMKFALFLFAFHVPATLAETTYKITTAATTPAVFVAAALLPPQLRRRAPFTPGQAQPPFQDVSLSSTATAQPINGTFRTRPILASLAPIRMASVANPAPTIK